MALVQLQSDPTEPQRLHGHEVGIRVGRLPDGRADLRGRRAASFSRNSSSSRSRWYNTRRVGETASSFKVLIEEGPTTFPAHTSVDEVINLFAVAIRQRIPAPELQQVICAYPTYSSDVRFML